MKRFLNILLYNIYLNKRNIYIFYLSTLKQTNDKSNKNI